MKLTCPNNHSAVIRNDPESTGQRAMCDVCGWEAVKVAAEWDRVQKQEATARKQLARGQEEEERHQHPARR